MRQAAAEVQDPWISVQNGQQPAGLHVLRLLFAAACSANQNERGIFSICMRERQRSKRVTWKIILRSTICLFMSKNGGSWEGGGGTDIRRVSHYEMHLFNR